MPPIRYWEVIQTRTVKISAPTPESAALVASRAFDGTNVADSVGRIQSDVRVVEVVVREDR